MNNIIFKGVGANFDKSFQQKFLLTIAFYTNERFSLN